MAIIQKDNFEYFVDSKGSPKILILKEKLIDSQINYILINEIKAVSLNYWNCKDLVDIKFLEQFTFLEELIIDDLNVSFKGLYKLVNLKSVLLTVKNKNQYLDFNLFPRLTSLSVSWFDDFANMSQNITLRDLEIWKFKPKIKSFEKLGLPKQLERLQITETNIESFQGINCDEITQLEAYFCPKLVSIKGIKIFALSLKTLIIENAKNLRDFNELEACVNLEKIILINCGEIPSLNFLKKFTKLKMFTFNKTKIIDGDLWPLKSIEYVFFKNEKHYNMKLKEFNF